MSVFNLSPYFTNVKLSKVVFDTVKCFKLGSAYINSINRRCFSQILHENPDDLKVSKFLPFADVLKARKLEANRSILVQVQSTQSHKQLYAYCNSIAHVKHMFHYTAGVEPLHFIIVEFEKESDVDNILSNSSFVEEAQIVPVESIFLWFKAPSKTNSKVRLGKGAKLLVDNGTSVIQDTEIKERLHAVETVSEQMVLLQNLIRLNDVGTRLRFLVAKQLESALSGLFPHASAYPFGSSVNGYGKMGCDLDIVLRLEEKPVVPDGRLIFHSKARDGNNRFTSQRHMDTIGDVLTLFLPGCAQVRKILQARVPIIKYYQQLADVECDLSMSNMSGVFMSELLYAFGEMDERVRPLVFTIRKWASDVGLTSQYPGRWITNFSLTLMVLAFLQKPGTSPPILPSVNSLVKAARPEDKYITEDGIDCTFLRDLNTLPFPKNNTDSLENLLEQFFEYYSLFNFSSTAICLNEPAQIVKPDHSPLYIVNPLERGLNVSKNISAEELQRLKMEMRNAAWLLESTGSKTHHWGILSLLESRRKMYVKPGKLIEVSSLFDNEMPIVEEFNNAEVEQQVKTIKKETTENINKLAGKLNRRNSER